MVFEVDFGKKEDIMNIDWSAIFTGVGVVITIFLSFWKLSAKLSMLQTSMESIDFRLGNVEKDVNDLKIRVGSIETRVTVMETILSMMGAPLKEKK
jgi:hypothetical protein